MAQPRSVAERSDMVRSDSFTVVTARSRRAPLFRRRGSWCSVAVLVVAIGTTSTAGEWDLRGQQIGPRPLPFQAARIRVTLRNIGDQVEGPLSSFPAARIKFFGRKQHDYHMLHASPVLFDGFHGLDVSSRDRKNPQLFNPDDEISTSVALAPIQFENNYGVKVRLFNEPGRYYFMEGWGDPARRDDYEIFSQPIVVNVAEPKDDDLKIFLRLRRQDDVVDAILSPVGRVEEDLVSKLEAIVKEYPKSSYADYARFALARNLASGIGGSNPPSDVAMFDAVEQLRAIDHENFGYGDYSLALCRKLLHRLVSPDEEKAVAERLDKSFPDSLVRLDDLAQRLKPEEWNKLNPRKPVQHKSADKKQ